MNSLAPYILTCLIRRPKRLVYTSSGLHRSGDAKLERPDLEQPDRRRIELLRRFEAAQCHSCLFRCAQMARRVVQCRGPRLGSHEDGRAGSSCQRRGRGADAGVAGSEPGEGRPVPGRYFHHQQPRSCHPAARVPGSAGKVSVRMRPARPESRFPANRDIIGALYMVIQVFLTSFQ